MNPTEFKKTILQLPDHKSSFEERVLSLTPLEREHPAPSVSLYIELQKNGLSAQETKLSRSIVEAWPLFSSVCLLDIMGLDVDCHFATLIKSYKAAEEALIEIRSSFYTAYFHTYLNLYLVKTDDPLLVRSQKIKSFFGGFAPCIEKMEEVETSLSVICPAPVKGDSAKARLQKRAYGDLPKSCKLLADKISLLQKFLQTPKLRPYLLDACLAIFKESNDWDKPSLKKQPLLLSYVGFIDTMIKDLRKHKRIGLETNAFSDIFPCIEKKKLARISQIYTENTRNLFNIMANTKSLRDRAINDPSFTHSAYCEEMKIQRVAQHDQEHFIAMLNAQFITASIFSYWLEDIQFCLTHNIAPEMKQSYRPSSTYINRINMLLFWLKARSLIPSASSTESEIGRIVSLAKESAEGAFSFASDFFANIDQAALLSDFETIASRTRFSLIPWISLFDPFYEISKTLPEEGAFWEKLRNQLFAELAKSGKHPSLEFKEEFRQALIEALTPYAMMTMILEDVRALFKGKQISDVVHLLPDSFVRLTSLEGWDELFPEETVPPLAAPVQEEAVVELEELVLPPPLAAPVQEEAVVELEELVLPPPPAAKKKPEKAQQKPQPAPKQAPTRKEFLAATKKRLILGFLKEAEFVFSRQAKGSHELWVQQNSGRTVLVPQDVNDPKTRSEMYKSAFGDEDAKMASENDNS